MAKLLIKTKAGEQISIDRQEIEELFIKLDEERILDIYYDQFNKGRDEFSFWARNIKENAKPGGIIKLQASGCNLVVMKVDTKWD